SIDLEESFNVVEFHKLAHQAIKEILSRGAVPIVVGGTGFYLHALIYGPPSGPPADPELRRKLEEEMERRGAEALYEWLKEKDPVYAATITQRDRHKIIRALEIIVLTHQRVSELPRAEQGHAEHYDFRCWFLHMPKELLYPRIDTRCDRMILQGFLDEVKRLVQEGLVENSTASQAIGYRQALDYLNSSQTPDDWENFVKTFKQASRRYAKRQFTWFRREQPLFRWVDISATPLDVVAELIIQDYEQI
ncbi:MAG: tRNA (adenosine(37)-N6)-dimethylallyltransferase MiaA, partial [Bacteroidetes bacterium]|nr:tRNA (adenosine(37)-N6)-dimethylallyltransferase MiaA [Bacteroidota bacterium]